MTLDNPAQPPVYITAEAAADALASRPWTVAELIGSGDLRAVQYDGRLLVSVYDVQQLGGVLP